MCALPEERMVSMKSLSTNFCLIVSFVKFSPRKFTTATSFPIKSAANGMSEVITKSFGVSPFEDFVVSYIKASRNLKKS